MKPIEIARSRRLFPPLNGKTNAPLAILFLSERRGARDEGAGWHNSKKCGLKLSGGDNFTSNYYCLPCPSSSGPSPFWTRSSNRPLIFSIFHSHHHCVNSKQNIQGGVRPTWAPLILVLCAARFAYRFGCRIRIRT